MSLRENVLALLNVPGIIEGLGAFRRDSGSFRKLSWSTRVLRGVSRDFWEFSGLFQRAFSRVAEAFLGIPGTFQGISGGPLDRSRWAFQGNSGMFQGFARLYCIKEIFSPKLVNHGAHVLLYVLPRPSRG